MRRLVAVAVVLAATATPGKARANRVGGTVGAGVTGHWDASGGWYGNVIAGGAVWWRDRAALVVDGGLSPGGAGRGQLWGGGGVRLALARMPFDIDRPGYFRPWVEIGAAVERWGSRDRDLPAETRRVWRAGAGYDLAFRGGLGSQAFMRVQHGGAIGDDEVAETSVVIGLAVVYDR